MVHTLNQTISFFGLLKRPSNYLKPSCFFLDTVTIALVSVRLSFHIMYRSFLSVLFVKNALSVTLLDAHPQVAAKPSHIHSKENKT